MIELPQMLLVGSGQRGAGKTALACSLISRLRESNTIVGVKVTTIHEMAAEGLAHEVQLNESRSEQDDFEIVEETDIASPKDTSRLLAAGSERVYRIVCRAEYLAEATRALLERIGENELIVCESNSLRHIVKPGLFLMVEKPDRARYRPSAMEVKHYADRIVSFDGRDFNTDLGNVSPVDGRWTLKEDASAVIMAGGASMRMGRDKSLLPLGGRTIIEHIYTQLHPHFQEVLVSTNGPNQYAFLGARVVPDAEAGFGPLAGILAALEASRTHLNFVTACDMPEVNLPFIRYMISVAQGYDGVVPKGRVSGYEPLFAVYQKSMIEPIRSALAKGRLRVTEALFKCRIKFVELPEKRPLVNLNTIADYEEYLRNRNDTV